MGAARAGALSAVAGAVAFGLACGGARCEDAAAPPVAVAARLTQDAGAARLALEFSAPVAATARTLASPNRIVVDLPEVNFQLDPAIGRPTQTGEGGLVKAFRFGLLGPGKSRIVIDLGEPACPGDPVSKPIARGAAASRLVIEMKRCDGAAFAARKEAAPPPAALQAAAPPAPAGPPTIVLDPGHGGVDGGAYGVGGAVEKSLVFAFCAELQRKLEATKRYRVVMTRTADSFVSLDDRVRIARDSDAALFVSVHADMLGEAADVSGATVYTIADRASDAEAARIAERENSADKAAGVERDPEAAGVADILFDLKRRESRTYAHLFSRNLVGAWRGVGRLNHNPERSAGFVVLKAPDFPSVLVELGYLSNPQDVQALNSPDWREKTAGAMAKAIDRFFAESDPAADKAEPVHGVAAAGSPPH